MNPSATIRAVLGLALCTGFLPGARGASLRRLAADQARPRSSRATAGSVTADDDAGPFTPPWNDEPTLILGWDDWCAFEQREGCYACKNTAGAGKYCTAMCADMGCPGFDSSALSSTSCTGLDVPCDTFDSAGDPSQCCSVEACLTVDREMQCLHNTSCAAICASADSTTTVTSAPAQGHSSVFTDELIASIPTPVELPATLYMDSFPDLKRCQGYPSLAFNGEFELHTDLHFSNPQWCNAEKGLCLRFEGSPTITSWALVHVSADHTDSTVLARIKTTANQIPVDTTDYTVSSSLWGSWESVLGSSPCLLDSVTISRTELFESACTQSLDVVGSAASMTENCADDKEAEVTSILAENDNPRFNLIGYGQCQTEFGNDGTYRSVKAGSLQECQTRCMAFNAAYNAGFEDGQECLGIEYSFHESSCKLFLPGEYIDRTDCSLDEPCSRANLYRCYRYLGERYEHLVSGQLSVNDKCPLYESRQLLAVLKPAAENFHQCSDKIESVAGTLGNLKKGSQHVKDATEMLAQMTKDMNAVVELIEKPPPTGTGIGQMLSLVPEFGVYIKMGIKTAETVSKSLLKVTRKVNAATEKFDKAINYTEKVFSTASKFTGPVSKGLSGGAQALEAAIGCTTSVCNDVNEELETISSGAVKMGALDVFDDVAYAGEICYAALSPIDEAMQVIGAAAEVFEKLLAPAEAMLDAMVPFVNELHRMVERFKELMNTDAAKCVKAIFDPVTDVANLLTCPIMEVAQLFEGAVDTLLVEVGTVVQILEDDLITDMIEAVVPENIGEVVPEIPDFRSHLLPSDLVSLTCIATSMHFTDHASTIQYLATIPLPAQVFPDDLQDQLLAKALSATHIPLPDLEHAESACAEAFKDMTETEEFQSCKGIAKPIAQVASAVVEVEVYQFCPICSITREVAELFGAIFG